jgi:hypothetical protein
MYSMVPIFFTKNAVVEERWERIIIAKNTRQKEGTFEELKRGELRTAAEE